MIKEKNIYKWQKSYFILFEHDSLFCDDCTLDRILFNRRLWNQTANTQDQQHADIL